MTPFALHFYFLTFAVYGLLFFLVYGDTRGLHGGGGGARQKGKKNSESEGGGGLIRPPLRSQLLVNAESWFFLYI